MSKEIAKTTGGHASPFERIKRTNDAGFNSGHHIADHFGDVTEMVEIGRGDGREVSVTEPVAEK